MDEFESEDYSHSNNEPIGYEGDFLHSSGNHFWIDGVHLSPFECPGCLDTDENVDYEDRDCALCEFFDPENCVLLLDTTLQNEVKTLFNLFREWHSGQFKQYVEHRESLVRAIVTELKMHGRPLHYTLLAEMIADRYPSLIVTEKRVLKIMSHRPHLFMKITEGVYKAI